MQSKSLFRLLHIFKKNLYALIDMNSKQFELKGQTQNPINMIVGLIIAVVVAVLVLIFGGALGGQTYTIVEPDLDSITDEEIKNSTKTAIKSGFTALEQTGKYLPLVVLSVVIAIVLSMVIGFGMIGGTGGYGGGSAL